MSVPNRMLSHPTHIDSTETNLSTYTVPLLDLSHGQQVEPFSITPLPSDKYFSLSSYHLYTTNYSPVNHYLKNSGALSLLLLVGFMTACLILRKGRYFFSEGLQMLFTFYEKKDTYNQITIKELWIHIFLCTLPIFMISIISYLFLQEQYPDTSITHHKWGIIALFMLLCAAFFIGRYLVHLIIGYTFDIQDTIRRYHKTEISVFEIFGILIFIPTLLYIYSPYHMVSTIALFVIVGIFILSQIVLFVKSINVFFNKKAIFSIGIVYLCSVEIVPYILLLNGFYLLYEKYYLFFST